MPRHYRRRSMQPRAVIQSYKKILNYAPASHSANTDIPFNVSLGKDSVAAGQTGVTDQDVPTGSIIKSFEIQWSGQNLVNIAGFLHVTIALLNSQQVNIPPNTVGGNPIRNQIFYQRMKSIGQNQNTDFSLKFKVPRKFQRVREGSFWVFTVRCSVVWTDACQIIYKFYR